MILIHKINISFLGLLFNSNSAYILVIGGRGTTLAVFCHHIKVTIYMLLRLSAHYANNSFNIW